MKSILLLIIAMALFGIASAQEPTDTTNTPVAEPEVAPEATPEPQPEEAQDPFALSDPPSTQELVDLIVKAGSGICDPFLAVQAITAKGESAVPELTEILFSDSLYGTADESDSSNPSARSLKPGKVYALLALEAIGSQQAYDAILQAGLTHSENEIIGDAVRAIAGSFYNRALSDSALSPGIDLVRLLLRNADNGGIVDRIQTSVAELAREGLARWTGIQLGEHVSSAETVTVNGQEMSLETYRESQWDAMRSNLQWRRVDGKFTQVEP